MSSSCLSSEEDSRKQQEWQRRQRRRSRCRSWSKRSRGKSAGAGEDETDADEATERTLRSKTLTERDVRQLERQLSMKKTIRKKMMRDLRQAFVADGENAGIDAAPEQDGVLLLDMLRGSGDQGSDDSGIGGDERDGGVPRKGRRSDEEEELIDSVEAINIAKEEEKTQSKKSIWNFFKSKKKEK